MSLKVEALSTTRGPRAAPGCLLRGGGGGANASLKKLMSGWGGGSDKVFFDFNFFFQKLS